MNCSVLIANWAMVLLCTIILTHSGRNGQSAGALLLTSKDIIKFSCNIIYKINYY